MKKSVFLIILSLAIGANAATFTVTKTADTADGTCNADCSLREAITAANALAGADVIVLPAGIYTTTIATTNDNANANGDFDITANLSIIGAGESSTFVEANASPGVAFDRVFHILGSSTNVLIEGLTVRNGRTPAAAPAFRGGGIRNEGNLTLRKVTVSGNQTNARGGGITSTNPGTSLFLDRVTVTNNTANSTIANTFGGGVFTNFSTVRIRKSTFTSNQAITTVGANLIGVGGGFYALEGDITIKDSSFSNNLVGGTSASLISDGAGLRFVNQTQAMNVTLDRLTITNNQILTGASLGAGIGAGVAAGTTTPLTITLSNSTISNNSAASSVAAPGGAGLFLNGVGLVSAVITNTNIVNNTATSTNPSFPSSGGGIYCNDAALTLQSSNISGNSAEIGGGIRNDSSPSDVAAVTSSVILNGSTVSGNTSTDGGAIANVPTITTVAFPVGGTTNLSLKNSTVSGNFAKNNGGAIFQDQPSATISTTVINNSTIVSNRADSDNIGGGNGGGINNAAGTLTVKNTIVANNSVGLPPLAEGKSDDLGSVTGVDLAGIITSADYNLFETISGATISGASGNNINGVDPNLASFADNGGFGKTYRLNMGSAARDAGDPTNCQDNSNVAVMFDERGLPRNQGGVQCDIGALEEGGIVWDGGGAGNNFSTAANWEGDIVPGTSNYVIFSGASGKNITVDGSREVRGVIYGGGYAGNMTIDGGDLRVRDIFYLSGGNITCINEGFVNMAVGASFQRYSGYVAGRISHDFVPGSSENFVYPTGTALGYYPATINYVPPTLQKNNEAESSGISSFSVRANDGIINGVNANQSVNVNWTLESFGVSPADLTLNYADENVAAVGIEENFQFIRRSESVNTALAPSIADTFDNSFKLSGVSSFSTWTLGSLAPTAASVAIGGRVLTPNGGGIKGAVVVLAGGNLPTPIYSQTNTFGYYQLPAVSAGQTYVITVNSKRYTFSNPSQIVNLQDNLLDLDFVSDAN
jgi:CSLREA domain-containing protein